MYRLQDYKLTINAVITTPTRDTPVWEQFHNQLVAHSQTCQFTVQEYSICDPVTRYSNSPWLLLDLASRSQNDGSRKAVVSGLTGPNMTLNSLAKIGDKLSNPLSDGRVLIFGMFYSFYFICQYFQPFQLGVHVLMVQSHQILRWFIHVYQVGFCLVTKQQMPESPWMVNVMPDNVLRILMNRAFLGYVACMIFT